MPDREIESPSSQPPEQGEPEGGAPPNVAAALPEDALVPIRVFARTDIGCVRTNNEDTFGYDEALRLFVVCDGMGGMASGEVASARAAAGLLESFRLSSETAASVSARLLQAVQAANRDVWDGAQAPEHKGMGTTLVAAAVDGQRLIVANVGDSRAYVLRGGHCIQLTVDHSYINELIRNGTLTVENARNADLQGMESVICRAIGAAADVEPDFFSVDLEAGTKILLATDGLTRYLLQDEIAAVVDASPLESACANLIDLAKQRGGVDNITCLLLVAGEE